jgi:hypothetical protein
MRYMMALTVVNPTWKKIEAVRRMDGLGVALLQSRAVRLTTQNSIPFLEGDTENSEPVVRRLF